MKLKSVNPHNQSIVGELEISTKPEIEKTVYKAKKAFEKWRFVAVEKRVQYIKKYRNLILKNKEKLAKLTTLEMGKPIIQSFQDVDWEVEFLDYYIKFGPKFLKEKTRL